MTQIYMLNQNQIDWLRLVLTPEIGARRGRRLLEKFRTPKAILEAPLDEIAQVENIGFGIAKKIVDGRKNLDLARQIKLIEKNNVNVIPQDSPDYPAQLKSTYDPPLVLFVKGKILPQDYFSVAIVGTRLASFYARSMSEKLSRQLVEKGFSVVSGGARGVDTFSHYSALKAKGRTLAVLGCGLDIAYPLENKKLFEEIAEKGALVSEFPMGTVPDKKNFPMRNRIISGLSLGVVVVEAPQKSGSLITVTHAIDQGREVFSVPGKADDFLSRGSNQLLKEGAKLVEDAEDIVEEFTPILRNRVDEIKAEISCCHSACTAMPLFVNAAPALSLRGANEVSDAAILRKNNVFSGLAESRMDSALPRTFRPRSLRSARNDEEKVQSLLSSEPIHLDALLEKTGMDIPKISAILLNLEIQKIVRELPGKNFIRRTNGE